jgi:S-adenosylmethionine:tRNA-ribosyltransferase-isomerase (queuine synthetase)
MANRVLHEPQLDTILMIEKAILDAEDYPTRMELWKSLPRKVQYQTFKRVLDYLEASGKIAFNKKKIIYTGVSGPKLEALIKTSVKIR